MIYQSDTKARLRWRVPMKLVPVFPTKRMLKAASAAMSPQNRPTSEWVSNSVKHSIRYQAMIAAAPDLKNTKAPA